jgi:hypothetical protein
MFCGWFACASIALPAWQAPSIVRGLKGNDKTPIASLPNQPSRPSSNLYLYLYPYPLPQQSQDVLRELVRLSEHRVAGLA